jgi:hypothetical protein
MLANSLPLANKKNKINVKRTRFYIKCTILCTRKTTTIYIPIANYVQRLNIIPNAMYNVYDVNIMYNLYRLNPEHSNNKSKGV